VRFRVRTLGLIPAPLPRVLIAEAEVQHARFRVVRKQRLDPALDLQRIEALRTQRKQAGMRVRVARVVLQQAPVVRLGLAGAPRARLDRGDAEQRIAGACVVA
jgi:hypothetical protein